MLPANVNSLILVHCGTIVHTEQYVSTLIIVQRSKIRRKGKKEKIGEIRKLAKVYKDEYKRSPNVCVLA